jgi:hypothetical protein
MSRPFAPHLIAIKIHMCILFTPLLPPYYPLITASLYPYSTLVSLLILPSISPFQWCIYRYYNDTHTKSEMSRPFAPHLIAVKNAYLNAWGYIFDFKRYCICKYMYLFVYMSTYKYAHIYTCHLIAIKNAYLNARGYIFDFKRYSICIYVYIYIYIHIYMYIYIYVHVFVCIYQYIQGCI